LEKQLTTHPLAESEDLSTLYDAYGEKMKIAIDIKNMKRKITDAQSIVQLDELKSRKRVMRR
jgi:ATP-dependent RNA helicase DOB1